MLTKVAIVTGGAGVDGLSASLCEGRGANVVTLNLESPMAARRSVMREAGPLPLPQCPITVGTGKWWAPPSGYSAGWIFSWQHAMSARSFPFSEDHRGGLVLHVWHTCRSL